MTSALMSAEQGTNNVNLIAPQFIHILRNACHYVIVANILHTVHFLYHDLLYFLL